MRTIQTLQMAVESPAPGIRVIRTAGTLDRQAAARLLRLVDAQIAQAAAGHASLTHLIVDLANVNRFEPGGMETLHQHRSAGRTQDVGLHLTGGGGRLALLPVRVRHLLRDFSTFPSAEVAVAALTGKRHGRTTGRTTGSEHPRPAIGPRPAGSPIDVIAHPDRRIPRQRCADPAAGRP
jgi:ABC-type transporter Mla MlaB component